MPDCSVAYSYCGVDFIIIFYYIYIQLCPIKTIRRKIQKYYHHRIVKVKYFDSRLLSFVETKNVDNVHKYVNNPCFCGTRC